MILADLSAVLNSWPRIDSLRRLVDRVQYANAALDPFVTSLSSLFSRLIPPRDDC